MRSLLYAAAIALLATLVAPDAHAWKPTMHVHLADEARADALDGFVDLDIDVQYRAQNAGPLAPRAYEVDPAVRQALIDHPQQFRAGTLGPDAYPDLLTGQSIIHADDHNPHAFSRGSDAWLSLLWNEAQADLAAGDDRPLAFVLGILAHAAGDMYAHTFVNHYAGGPWELGDNAVTHMIVEGYVGNRSPAPVFDMHIDGLESFIYEHMIDATTYPRTPIAHLYEAKGPKANPALPWFFSNLRSALQEFVDDWHAMSDSDPKKWVTAPAVPYANAWMNDIDRGLRAWPGTSTEIANAIFFNASGDMDGKRAKAIFEDYFYLHVVSMLGAPDLVGDVAWLADEILDALSFAIPDPLAALKDRILDFLVEEATGRSKSEWESFVKDPESHMTTWPVLTSQGLCGPGRFDCKNEIDAAMGIDPADPGDRIDWRAFSPARNTVTMIKLAMLSADGRRDLMSDLGFPPSVELEYAPLAGPMANAMIGFMRSLDESRQWNAHEDMMLTHFDCWLYQQTFSNQAGDVPGGAAYAYTGGDPNRIDDACADLALAEFTQVQPGEAFCGKNILTRIGLDDRADLHGAVVRLSASGPLSAPRFAYIQAGMRSNLLYLPVQPVATPQTLALTAERESAISISAQVRPPRIQSPAVRARTLGGERGLADGAAILGGTPVAIEARVDCNNAVPGATVQLQICPTGPFFGICRSASVAPGDVWETELPFVRQDQDWAVRASFNGNTETRNLRLLASEVRSVALGSSGGTIGIQAGQTTATVELLDPPAADKIVYLDYAAPLTGPASVVFPAGQRTQTVPVGIAASVSTQTCASSRGLVLAISKADRDRYGPLVNGRERWDDYLAQGAGVNLGCFLPIDPRLEAFGGPFLGTEFDFEPELDPYDPFDPAPHEMQTLDEAKTLVDPDLLEPEVFDPKATEGSATELFEKLRP